MKIEHLTLISIIISFLLCLLRLSLIYLHSVKPPQRTGKIYDNEITSLIDIYFLRISFIHQTFLDTLSDVLESAHAYL